MPDPGHGLVRGGGAETRHVHPFPRAKQGAPRVRTARDATPSPASQPAASPSGGAPSPPVRPRSTRGRGARVPVRPLTVRDPSRRWRRRRRRGPPALSLSPPSVDRLGWPRTSHGLGPPRQTARTNPGRTTTPRERARRGADGARVDFQACGDARGESMSAQGLDRCVGCPRSNELRKRSETSFVLCDRAGRARRGSCCCWWRG